VAVSARQACILGWFVITCPMAMKGRKSIYRGKDLTKMRSGLLTPRGNQAFELARKELAQRHRLNPEDVSTGDVMEFLALRLHP